MLTLQWFLIGAGSIIFVLFVSWLRNIRKYPPGPFPIPILGNLLQLNPKAPHKTIFDWRKKYGPIFTVWLPEPSIMIMDYDLMKEAVIKNGDCFAGRPIGYVLARLAPDSYGAGVIICEGDKWREQRRFVMQVLRDLGFGRSVMEDGIMDQTSVLVQHFRDQMADGKSGKSVLVCDLPHQVQTCVGNIINVVTLGYTWKHDDPRFGLLEKALQDNMRIVGALSMRLLDYYPWMRFIPIPGLFPMKRMVANQDVMLEFFMKEVDEHKQMLQKQEEPNDLATIYLLEMKRRKEAGEDMGFFDEYQLGLVVGDIWAAGMETTVTTLKWGLLFMMRNPRVQQKVQDEIDQVLGRDTRVRMSDRNSLPYVQATINEIQRMANLLPINLPHKCQRDINIGGVLIPQNATVFPQISAVMMDPEHFPEPDEFRPDRFLAPGSTEKLVPFSMGKRQCLGEGLARMELFLIFTTLLQQFRFGCVDEANPPSLEPVPGITLTPNDFECVLYER